MLGFWSLMLIPGVWPLGVASWRLLQWYTPLGPWLMGRQLTREFNRSCVE
jgi:hypothetical protein